MINPRHWGRNLPGRRAKPKQEAHGQGPPRVGQAANPKDNATGGGGMKGLEIDTRGRQPLKCRYAASAKKGVYTGTLHTKGYIFGVGYQKTWKKVGRENSPTEKDGQT